MNGGTLQITVNGPAFKARFVGQITLWELSSKITLTHRVESGEP